MAGKEPTWAIILHTLYENKLAGRTFIDHGYTGLSRQIAIAEETDLELVEVTSTIYQMVDQDLITDVNPKRPKKGYKLTETGFDVAQTRDLRRQERRREQQRDKRQHDVNRAIAFLTLALVFIEFLQATITILVNREIQPLYEIIAVVMGNSVI